VHFLLVVDFTDSGSVYLLAIHCRAAQIVVHRVAQVRAVTTRQSTKETSEPMQTVVLRNMKKNQSGIITAVSVAGELGRRLREMGLTPGTEISVCGRAPLKDPVAIRVLNSILTLRNNEAEHIHVQIDNNK